MDNLLTYPTELLLLLFMTITFLQSAMDKILDWKGNLSWLKSHFSQTPFKNMVPLLLGTVMVTEIVTGVFCTIGFYMLIVQADGSMAFAGAILACLALLMLLLGQRVAKDYDGARTIAIYFIPAIFLVYLLH
ncbi:MULTISPECIES: DoxX family protein [unclassified Arenibacter]|uniref:DoxX family protein n=1 Tax=unclassified Arenibacter TaxID=2615047 RepID=UPI000E34A477|nr:DoxX family protein [Arenibacter sp. A80]MCM4161985.1 DoxX family protein [Arenibacter sp. A80]RFT58320.1 DoxX family protein [Arenibacter sp. P308M17]